MKTSSTMTAERSSESGVKRGTGREREEWFVLLDTWGAAGRPFREIADWLKTKHDLSHWWAQKLIVEYEQARGIRPPGVRPGGTFTVTATKTMNVSVKRLFEAFTDAKVRKRWLAGAKMRKRTSEPGRSARFDWDDSTRVNASFLEQGKGKSQVAVEHTHLANTKAAEKTKAYWRERLTALKALLEEAK
jgi:uncharacterized protein YndB with AHSA1/START domain